jgi:hypothetical protein
VGRTVAVVVIGIIEAILGAKKQATNAKHQSQHRQNQLNIHTRYPVVSNPSMAKFSGGSNFP